MSDLRLGRIAYTNVAPIETAFDAGAVVRPATVTAGAPAHLNALMDAGALDAAPMSAAHFVRNHDRYALLGDVCIAARGPVISVVLVSPTPPALLAGASIAVTRDSSSGRALLETLLRDRYGVTAAFEPVDDPAAAARGGRPALLIGDAAIDIAHAVPPTDVHDLGRAWYEWTGLPMVFAVWAVRRQVAAVQPATVAALAQALALARAWGERHRDEVIAAATAQRPRERAFYARYFTTLSYVFDDAARHGLARFAGTISPPEVLRAAR